MPAACGSPSCAQVRFARSRVFIPAGSGPEDNRQLFFSRAPACASESDVVALFNRWAAPWLAGFKAWAPTRHDLPSSKSTHW
jgi:hypothetical protein